MRRRKIKRPEVIHRCGECVHVKDRHAPSLSTGENLIGRCPFVDNGEHCILLSRVACRRFEKKWR